MRFFLATLIGLILAVGAQAAPGNAGYVGSDSCKICHH